MLKTGEFRKAIACGVVGTQQERGGGGLLGILLTLVGIPKQMNDNNAIVN